QIAAATATQAFIDYNEKQGEVADAQVRDFYATIDAHAYATLTSVASQADVTAQAIQTQVAVNLDAETGAYYGTATAQAVAGGTQLASASEAQRVLIAATATAQAAAALATQQARQLQVTVT